MTQPATALTSSIDGPDRATQLEIFRRMALIKLCDERMLATIKAGRLIAPYYSPRGQEAVAAAMGVALRQDDYFITIYRGLHDHLARGVPLRSLWAEYAGKITGSCKGKGGPMHITHPGSGVMVTTGIVGSGLPIANGFGWASLVTRDGRVTVTSFGDGAANIGAFHEALNLASLWKLPVVFLCQNNGYAEHTRYEYGTAVASIAERAASYSMPGARVDGNDPVLMWRTARAAVERARRGEGPTLIEAMTFRFNGHNFGDPGEYIPREHYEAARARDPYPAYRERLIRSGAADEAQLAEVEQQLTREIDDAVEFALSSPLPGEEELGRDVYDEEIRP